MSKTIFSVGVDLGGTWIRLVAVDHQGRAVRSLKTRAPAVMGLPIFLKKRFQAWKIKPEYLAIGSRAIWAPVKRARLKRRCASLAQHVTVMSDVESAWIGAFGKNGEGTFVISGTGSIAYARDSTGRFHRAGGLGPQRGDEGSAFWIGKQWLRKMNPASFRRKTVRQVAARAPQVLRLAQRGHPEAQSIVRDAQRHLADIAVEASRGLRFKRSIPLSWGGSLLNNSRFRTGFLKVLREKNRRFRLKPAAEKPVWAMARLSS